MTNFINCKKCKHCFYTKFLYRGSHLECLISKDVFTGLVEGHYEQQKERYPDIVSCSHFEPKEKLDNKKCNSKEIQVSKKVIAVAPPIIFDRDAWDYFMNFWMQSLPIEVIENA